MIQYTLRCDAGHQVESWFQSASAFDTLHDAGHLACAICGSAEVEKAVMAPRVKTGKDASTAVSRPRSDVEKQLAAMRKHVEANAEYVGGRFAAEARSMHIGTTPERAVYGEANRAEVKSLIEDGIQIMPLPFLPKNKAN